MKPLSHSEIEAYRENGIVVPSFRLPRETVTRLHATLDRLIAENPGVRPEKLISVHIEGQNDEGVRGSRDFLDLARDPALLDAIEQIIGPDIVLWGCQIFCKPGGDGMEVPWHQDGHFWPIRPLATCSAWIALDSSSVENGCLRVIPGSHRKRELLEHHQDAREDLVLYQALGHADSTELGRPMDIELEPGQMSLHDVYLIHGSNANRSPKRRAGVAIRYMPATSHFDRTLRPRSASAGYMVDFASRPIWLLRGVDRSGRNDFVTGHRGKASAA